MRLLPRAGKPTITTTTWATSDYYKELAHERPRLKKQAHAVQARYKAYYVATRCPEHHNERAFKTGALVCATCEADLGEQICARDSNRSHRSHPCDHVLPSTHLDMLTEENRIWSLTFRDISTAFSRDNLSHFSTSIQLSVGCGSSRNLACDMLV